MLFLSTLQDNCSRLADKPAVELLDSEQARISYAALEDGVQRSMTYLRQLGISPGDRVALQLPKDFPFIYLHLAIMRLGAVSLPLNPAYPPRELEYFLQDAAAALFIGSSTDSDHIRPMLDALPDLKEVIFINPGVASSLEDLLPAAAGDLPPPPQDPDLTALMVYTSGTTGRPKGAMITHGNLSANLNSLHHAWGWEEEDILLHVLPIFHVHGLVVALHGALHAGATTIMLPKFDAARTLNVMEERRCTVFMAVPVIHRRLLAAQDDVGADLSHMRLMTSGSDRLPDDLFVAYPKAFGHTLLERYGMTETGMNLSNPLHGERRVGSVGLPLPGVEARVVDPKSEEPLTDGTVGALQIRGPHVCKGYWRQPEKTAEAFTADGWLRTGDMALREADGYFTLKGRSKDLIITGGLNVYPPEVELVLAEHPQVALGVVIGCPDDEWGERVTAIVQPKPGMALDTTELIAFCRDRLAPYKAPKEVILVEQFPQTALGKIQKAQLREILCR